MIKKSRDRKAHFRSGGESTVVFHGFGENKYSRCRPEQ